MKKAALASYILLVFMVFPVKAGGLFGSGGLIRGAIGIFYSNKLVESSKDLSIATDKLNKSATTGAAGDAAVNINPNLTEQSQICFTPNGSCSTNLKATKGTSCFCEFESKNYFGYVY